MSFTFDIAGSQIDGDRDYQEDAYLISTFGDGVDDNGGTLVIVAGRNGRPCRWQRCQLIWQCRHSTSTSATITPPKESRENLISGTQKANQSITETVAETAALKGMGCTLIAATFEGREMHWISVGDSHVYLLRANDLLKKNADHSYGGFLDKMAEEGRSIEAESGYSRNMLLSALTGEEISEIDCPELPLELEAHDRIIVCTDGLDTLSKGKIIQFCSSSPTAKECVDALLQGIDEARMPRQDNTTVVVVDVLPDQPVEPIKNLDIPAIGESSEGRETTFESTSSRPVAKASRTAKPKTSGGHKWLIAGFITILVLIGAGYAYFTPIRF